MIDIDLPNFERNTELAKKKMIAKAKEKGNTWHMSPFDPFLYHALDAHSEKLKQRAQAQDIRGIVDAAADILNYCHMIIDNALNYDEPLCKDVTLGTPGANR